MYKIPCACQNTECVGANEDLHKQNTLSAEKRMDNEDGGLARHTMECQSGVDWGNAEIVARGREV